MLKQCLLLAMLCGSSVSHASFWLAEPNEAAIVGLIKVTEAYLDEEIPSVSALEKRPSSPLQWDCLKNPFEVLEPLGFSAGSDDAVFHKNQKRAFSDHAKSYDNPVVVPLSGQCQNERLEGEVSFWYSVEEVWAYMGNVARMTVYGRVDMTLRHGEDPEFRALSLRPESKKGFAPMPRDVRASVRSHAGDVRVVVRAVGDAGAVRHYTVEQRRRQGALWLVTAARYIKPAYENVEFPFNWHAVYKDGLLRSSQFGSQAQVFDDAGAKTESMVGVVMPRREYSVRQDNQGVFKSPITSDGVVADWVDKVVGINLGTKVVGMAGGALGDAIGRQVLGDVGGRMVGAAVGSRIGEAAGRNMALAAVGGEEALAASSDVSADSLTDLAGWLYEEHRDNPRLGEILTAAQAVYPDLGKQYAEVVKAGMRRQAAAMEAFYAHHLAAGRAKWVPPLFVEYAAQFQ